MTATTGGRRVVPPLIDGGASAGARVSACRVGRAATVLPEVGAVQCGRVQASVGRLEEAWLLAVREHRGAVGVRAQGLLREKGEGARHGLGLGTMPPSETLAAAAPAVPVPTGSSCCC